MVKKARVAQAPMSWQNFPEGAAVTREGCGVTATLSQTTAIQMASQLACVEVCDLLLATFQCINIPPYLSSHFQE